VLDLGELLVVGRDPHSIRFGGDLGRSGDRAGVLADSAGILGAGILGAGILGAGILGGRALGVDDPAPGGGRPAHRHAA
jgi:hypothetical protein